MPAVVLLGGASILVDGRAVAGRAAQRHRLALLALLALACPRAVSRDRLLAYLWPERDTEPARNLLKQAVHALRKALGDRAILSTPDELALDAGVVSCDVVAFESALARDDLERAVAHYGGPLLDGFHLPGASDFEHRIDGERTRLRRRFVQAVETLAERAMARRDPNGAVDCWRRIAVEEPYNGLVALRLMTALVAIGDRGSAIRQAREHAQRLRDDFDAEPDERVIALAEQLRRQVASTDDVERTDGVRAARSSGDGDGARTTRPSVSEASPSYPLVGRAAERRALRAAWDSAAGARSQFVLITGEAGIGKTRLAEELLESESAAGVDVARSRSYAAEGQLAYAPVADWLRSSALQPGLAAVDDVSLAEVARLLPEVRALRPDLPAVDARAESWQRQRFFSGVARAVLHGREDLLLLVDDLQWCDQDTLQWLHYLLRVETDVRVLVVGTARPEELEPSHALTALVHDLRRADQLTEIPLTALNAEETAALASHVAGRDLGADAAALYRDTEGNPLFVVESVRARMPRAGSRGEGVLDDLIVQTSEREAMPPRMQSVIQSRLAQLSPAAQRLANVAATIGRDFTLPVLRLACDPEDGDILASLDELWQRRIIREHTGERFDFSHDRLREVAYAALGPVRRGVLHRRVAEALRTHHAADLDAVSARIAAHYDKGGSPEEAIDFYQRAAEVAKELFANEEAIANLARALALLDSLPRGAEHDRRELSLRIAELTPLRAARGWAAGELGASAARARVLAERIGSHSERLRAACEMVSFQLVRGVDLRAALETASDALRLARTQDDRRLLTAAHHLLGITLCQRAEFSRSREHLEHAASLYEPSDHDDHVRLFGADFGVFSHAVAAHALWHLGYADRALASTRRSRELAERLGHPFSRAIALAYDAMLHQFLGDVDAVADRAGALIDVSGRHGFAYYQAWGSILDGWATAMRGDAERGTTRIHEGMAAIRATGAELRWSYYLSLIAGLCRVGAQRERGLALLDEALRSGDATGERWKAAELHRLRGELLLARGADEEAAEESLRRAREIAAQQEAKMLELRSSISLGRLLRRQRKVEEASRMLGETYAWFTEGFGTADLRCAAAQLSVPA